MKRGTYEIGKISTHRRRGKKPLFVVIGVCIIAAAIFGAYKLFFAASPAEKAASQLTFDTSVSPAEQQQISDAITAQDIRFNTNVKVSVHTVTETDDSALVLDAYVPVTGFYATAQDVTKNDVSDLANDLPNKVGDASEIAANPNSDTVALVSIEQLNNKVKLLTLDNAYYLDSFDKGAFFRQATFTPADIAKASNSKLRLNNLPGKNETLKINQTGVTALTRLMQRKLASVGDPTYFSAKIGDFLADADITHVSNEVSFRDNCAYNNAVFCSPPAFIETLKASGVNLVELTGNHNNDNGSVYNTETIKQYHELGWTTFGGGLNAERAAKPYIADKKGSKIAFLGYNAADGAGSGAIAGDDYAGANLYSDAKAKEDITAAKKASQFVIVDIQYAECQAYPAGYVEFPECDVPISGQQEMFRKMIDYGADAVIGSSAHQPQTFELYKNKPIYYGLGNLYFEQTQWPGTGRGIVLTHYFHNGALLQTKLTPTVYDRDYQTRIMTTDEANYFLTRLRDAR